MIFMNILLKLTNDFTKPDTVLLGIDATQEKLGQSS